MLAAVVEHTLHVLDATLARRHRRDLASGGLFLDGVDAERDAAITIVIEGAGQRALAQAIVVWPMPGQGVGVELRGLTPDARAAIERLLDAVQRGTTPGIETVAVTETETETGTETDETGTETGTETETEAETEPETETEAGAAAREHRDPVARSLHERLRRLTPIEQHKIARDGELAERVALERIYGKAVWEALLRNSRITPPEVARLARLGTLPRPLLELIASSGAWLSSPEIRRALLTNPRLGVDLAPRILRLLPKHELKLAASQSAYPAPVRDLAKRLLRE